MINCWIGSPDGDEEDHMEDDFIKPQSGGGPAGDVE